MPTDKTSIPKTHKSTGGLKANGASVDTWIAAAPDFARPILNYLRTLVHEAAPDAVEEMKWSRPFFVAKGTPVCFMAAFKQHCGFGFWSPGMNAVLQADGIAEPGASGSFGRIISLDDLPERERLLRYIRHAGDLARTGAASTPMASGKRTSAKPPVPVPCEFARALADSEPAAAFFGGLSPGGRREYLEWIATAKRPETRERRIREAVIRLTAGERFNEQYRTK